MNRQWSESNLDRIPDFHTFVMTWVNRKNVNGWKHFVPQYKFLCEPGSQTPRVDFVGRFECLHEDFALVQQRLRNHHSSLQHLNKTEAAKKDDREYYTEATRKLVAGAYEEDIRMFGYDFDNMALKKIEVNR